MKAGLNSQGKPEFVNAKTGTQIDSTAWLNPVSPLPATDMRYITILTSVLLLAGCTTTKKYEATSAAAGAPKSDDYPIYVYPESVAIPRPFEIIGTMQIGETPFTMMGGSLEGVLNTLMQSAREKGADAVQITNLKEPSFWTANYRAYANFLRFTDTWESVSLPEPELVNYFRTNAPKLDPVEGIWHATGPVQSRIAILRSTSKPGRDFVLVIHNTKNPAWKTGAKKADLRRDARPGIYRGIFYQDDYQTKKVVITFRPPETNQFTALIEETNPVVFVRE